MPADDVRMTGEVIAAMAMFSAASSSLLLINKLCIHMIPAPSLIATLQFAVCTVFIMALKCSGAATVDDWEWAKVQPYLLYIGMFVATIYCNFKALQYSNVETIIVFRACCPLIVSLLDWGFLGRQLPSARSACALGVLVAGAASYVQSDAAFKMQGVGAYTWTLAYFFIISIEMAYGKFIVGPHLKFKSMWGPTLYTNALAIVPMLVIGLSTNEADRIDPQALSPTALTLLSVSCLIGVAISFTGWYCRSLVTATCYTVLGVANKMVTVLANLLIWDRHASPMGIASLLVCLLGAAAYQQAPPREEEGSESTVRRRKLLVLVGVLGLGGATVFGASLGSGVPAAVVGLPPPRPSPSPRLSLLSRGSTAGPSRNVSKRHAQHTRPAQHAKPAQHGKPAHSERAKKLQLENADGVKKGATH